MRIYKFASAVYNRIRHLLHCNIKLGNIWYGKVKIERTAMRNNKLMLSARSAVFSFFTPKLLKFRKNYCNRVEINNIICYNYKDINFKGIPLNAVKIGK